MTTERMFKVPAELLERKDRKINELYGKVNLLKHKLREAEARIEELTNKPRGTIFSKVKTYFFKKNEKPSRQNQ